MFRNALGVLILLALVSSCRPEVYYPKPTGYFRLDTPATHEYALFDVPYFPYSFEYPASGIIYKDTVFDNKKMDTRFWINIYIPELGGIFNITYKEILPDQPLYQLMDDAWGLSYFHHEKADYINEQQFINPGNITGELYTIGGNAASRYQFTATDSTRNFLRGALYFDVAPNVDSLKPATDFMLQDIKHMLYTLRWR